MKAPFALADREVGPAPERHTFPPLAAYHEAWRFWRAVRRDAYPTSAELDAMHDALVWAIDRR